VLEQQQAAELARRREVKRRLQEEVQQTLALEAAVTSREKDKAAREIEVNRRKKEVAAAREHEKVAQETEKVLRAEVCTRAHDTAERKKDDLEKENSRAVGMGKRNSRSVDSRELKKTERGSPHKKKSSANKNSATTTAG